MKDDPDYLFFKLDGAGSAEAGGPRGVSHLAFLVTAVLIGLAIWVCWRSDLVFVVPLLLGHPKEK